MTSPLNFLEDGGEMGALMRAHDWSRTPFGAPETWPQNLRTVLRVLLSSNHPMFIWWGPQLIQFYNDAYRQTLGPERHPSALGQPGRECWQEIWPIIGPQIEYVLAGGATWHEDHLIPLTRHGRLEQIWWTYSYSPIDDPDGGVGGVLVVCNDVTRQHLTKEALRKSEEHFKFALEAGGAVGTWHWDVVNDVMIADERFAALFSIDPVEAARGSPLSNYLKAIHPDDREAIQRKVSAAVESGGDYSEEYRIVDRAGNVRWIQMRGRCYHDADGQPVSFPGVGVDMTERRAAMEALEQADHRKDEFLAMLGHELRNPLSPILSAAQVLQHAQGVDAKLAAQAVQTISRQTQHLRELVDDLLDVARITTGKITLKKDYIEIASAVYRAVEQTHDLIERSRHRFELSLPDAPVYVEGDLGRLTQVISNLLNNSAKYTEPGGLLKVTVEVAGDEVVISVSDTGMGISAEVLPQIFELFAQSRRALDRSQGGLGIGLTLVRRIVNMHHGRISAFSAGPGLGSKFTVWLPAIAQVTEQPARGKSPEKVQQKARRILVVDDNMDAAEMLTAVLSLHGHTVAMANDGLSVLARAREMRPDVILLDLGLPGLSGFEVARQLRAAPEFSGVKLIALTGYGQDDDRRQTHEHGFDHHMVKPVDFEALLDLLGASPA